MNKGNDKLEEIQLVQRNSIIKIGLGFNVQKKDQNQTVDGKIQFVKTKGKQITKPAQQSLLDKRIELKNPARNLRPF